MNKAVKHLAAIGVNDLWETPPDLFRGICIQYGVKPSLDVCATRLNRKCRYFFTEADDGLTQDWARPFYCNPPYSQVEAWLDKANREVRRHKITGLLLTFAKTDTNWWHRHVEGQHETHFHKGRIVFLRDGKPKLRRDGGLSGAPYPSVWIIMRPGL